MVKYKDIFFFTTTAEYILERHMSEVGNYASLRTSDNEFLVSISVMLKFDTFLPKILRVYEVKVINKVMIC